MLAVNPSAIPVASRPAAGGYISRRGGGTSVVHVAGQKDASIKQRFSFCAFTREFNSCFPFGIASLLLACICSLSLSLCLSVAISFSSLDATMDPSISLLDNPLARGNKRVHIPRECLTRCGCAKRRTKEN